MNNLKPSFLNSEPLEETHRPIVTFPLVGTGDPDASALMAILRRLSVANSLSEIMSVVTQAARSLLGADGISFVLRDGERCYYAEEDAIGPLWKGKRFPMSACISGWCMTNRQPAVVGNIFEDPRIPQDAYRPTFVRSLAMVPVRQDDPIAAIGAYWSTTRAISPRELDLLQSVANSTALAVAKIELEEERENARIAQLETSHRFKNLLALVDAISRQMSRSIADPKEFARTFSGRLQALARAQRLLTSTGAIGANICALVREQLMVRANDDRISCHGPVVSLSDAIAFDLGLVLHELGTNARKYGALCHDTGHIEVNWAVNSGDTGPVLAVSWIESGGPPVKAPRNNGFGTTLIRHAFDKHGGEVDIRYAPSGVRCNMRVPLEQEDCASSRSVRCMPVACDAAGSVRCSTHSEPSAAESASQ